MGCGMSMIKYLLFIFNLLCALCGILFIALGALFLKNVGSFGELVEELSIQQIPVGLIVLGSIIFLISFFGCCGAIRESHCMSITYAVSLFVLIVLDIVLVAYIFMTRTTHMQVAQEVLQKLWDKSDNRASAFNGIQTALTCCGLNGPSDYRMSSLLLPASCCAPDTSICTELNAFKSGCKPALNNFIESNAGRLAYIAIGIIVVEILGFIFACCLANHIRNHKRRSAY